MQLDALDRKLLTILDANSRISVKEMSKLCRVGSDVVVYRLNRFIEQKILNSTSVFVNPYPLGRVIYKSYLKLRGSKQQRQALINQLRSHPEVCWLAEIVGSWNLTVSIYGANPADFRADFLRILGPHREQVSQQKLFLLCHQIRYSRVYWPTFKAKEFVLGTGWNRTTIDRLDSEILQQLSVDARASLAELSRKIPLSPPAIKSRIERLEREQIIIGYTANINLSALGISRWKVGLVLRGMDSSVEAKLRKSLAEREEVKLIIEQVGEWPLELEVEVESNETFYAFIDELNNKFSTVIDDMQFAMYQRAHNIRIGRLPV